ncbi:Uncharacterised protein [uncultured Clostridium sp.]|nr:Uncharacterised protein [uncultured Clostridium sp.]
MKKSHYSGDVMELVKDDLEYGLSPAQVESYLNRADFSSRQKKLYSEALRDNFPKEVLEIAFARGLKVQQMQVACGYVRKGISEDALREVLSEERSAKEMSDMMQDILNRQAEDAAVPVTELSDGLQEQLDEVLQQKEYLEQQIEAKEKEIQEGLAKVASQRNIIEEQAARILELEERLEKRPARPQVSYEVQMPMEQGKPPVRIPVEVERKRSNDVGRFRMLFEKRKVRTDMVKLVSQADLSEGQLAAILAGMEQGLTQEQLTELVHCGATPEKMQIIVEIAVLENSMRREEA